MYVEYAGVPYILQSRTKYLVDEPWKRDYSLPSSLEQQSNEKRLVQGASISVCAFCVGFDMDEHSDKKTSDEEERYNDQVQEPNSLTGENKTSNLKYLFFDVISADELSYLFKYLSELPHNEHWLQNVTIENQISVLKASGTMCTAACQLFKSFQFNDSELIFLMAANLECLNVNGRELQKLANVCFGSLRTLNLGHDANAKDVEQVLSICGDSLFELHIFGNSMNE